VGHVPDQVTLPYGVMARLDAAAPSLELVEPGVAPSRA
jgi:muramoyltetrapeptide carboxypeptidase LdcA involved in peptidoglycan recycling